MDWLSGIRAAKLDNTYGSRYGLDGVDRTFSFCCCRLAVIFWMSCLAFLGSFLEPLLLGHYITYCSR
ncbi:hypothetical protein L5D93_30310 [Paenibacillus thiaminolyticus]|nr:hypothetical protein [Paenibacillus thiaminolyticus]